MLLADCALDEACSFFTVSAAGSDTSCGFYAWTSDKMACTASAQVRHGGRVGALRLVLSVPDML